MLKQVQIDRIKSLKFFLLFLLFLPVVNLRAWGRHNLIVKHALVDYVAYEKSDILVTGMSEDRSLNPEYKVIYINPDSSSNKADCNKFVNFDLDRGLYYGFGGKRIGERTSAYEILVDFSDEPDWGMDKGLTLSFAQKFMAGSQGFRHMYYPFWTFHIPYPFISQGDAPARAEHFFKRAVQEYKDGNIYASYRELARSIHYVMDMGQPFHTRQLYHKFINLRSPFSGTVQAIKNYHFAYETFVANLMQMEECTGNGILIEAIRNAEPIPAKDAKGLSVSIAIKSNGIAEKLFPVIIQVFGERFNSPQPQFLTVDEFNKLKSKGQATDELMRLTIEALRLTSGATKGLFLLFNKNKNSGSQINLE